MNKKYQVIIVGAGTAGITVAAQLKLKKKNLTIAIVDPADTHYYQPAWTLVAAGTYNFEDTARPMASLIPKGVTWVKEFVSSFNPTENQLSLRNGEVLEYDYLVACPGLQMDLDGIEGLKETMGKNNVCSNYIDPNYTWKLLQEFKGGNMLFTQPTTPIKCGGAPQKIMYLADDYIEKHQLKEQSTVIYATPGTVIFGVPGFKETMEKVIERKKINLKLFHKLVRIDGPNKLAYYEITKADDDPHVLEFNHSAAVKEQQITPNQVAIPFEFLHLAPPQSAPDFIKNSPLAYQDGPNKGWLNVDHFTLQHNTFKNVYGLGDSAALPTAKTGAAIRKQAPVVVAHIIDALDGRIEETELRYNGYSSCPLVTGYGKMVLAEFGYNNVPMPDPLISKFIDTKQESYLMWLLKKYGLPFLYWNFMMKGRA